MASYISFQWDSCERCACRRRPLDVQLPRNEAFSHATFLLLAKEDRQFPVPFDPAMVGSSVYDGDFYSYAVQAMLRASPTARQYSQSNSNCRLFHCWIVPVETIRCLRSSSIDHQIYRPKSFTYGRRWESGLINDPCAGAIYQNFLTKKMFFWTKW